MNMKNEVKFISNPIICGGDSIRSRGTLTLSLFTKTATYLSDPDL